MILSVILSGSRSLGEDSQVKAQSKAKYEYALARIEALLPLVGEETPLDDPNSIELDIVSDIVEKYEQEHYAVDVPSLTTL